MIRSTNIHVRKFEILPAPEELRDEFSGDSSIENHVLTCRDSIRQAMAGEDHRPLVIVGPCSIHDPQIAHDYASRLAPLAQELAGELNIVMRVYFEKPRTSIGWKGLINDPELDGSCDLLAGVRLARAILLQINGLGLGCATEVLDPIMPQYLSDLISWSAIGARTTESQTHREVASGLSMPVGFKNATDGDLDIALHGMHAARQPHAFLGLTDAGQPCVVRTSGNPDVHLVLRGGRRPNFSAPHLAFAHELLRNEPGERLILVDCSHGNTGKDFRKQPEVYSYIIERIVEGRRQGKHSGVLGMMLESNLEPGNQPLTAKESLRYGVSITDACLGWDDTQKLLRHSAVQLGKGAAAR